MPAVLLVSFQQAEAQRAHRRALNGDPECREWIENLFAGHDEVLCFLWDAEVRPPQKSVLVPDARNPGQVFAAAICTECAALPAMKQWARIIRICKAMWPGTHFYFPGRR